MYCIVMNLGIVGPFNTGEEALEHEEEYRRRIPTDAKRNDIGRVVKMISPKEDRLNWYDEVY